MTDETKRVAIVTGAGHGIGREIAIELAAGGIQVVAADLNPDWAQSVASEIGDNAFGYRLDVRDKGSIDALVTAVIDRFGQIDILVNNAGIYPNSPFLETSEDEWDAVFDTNLKGMFLVSQAVAREMVARGTSGRIVNLSSGASVSGRAGAAHYCSSKAAINMLTKVMAIELTPKGITVNAVAPGLIEVPDWEHTDEYINAIVSGIPAGRIGQPADIARAVTFLVSPDSDFISGSVMFVDGGSGAGRTTLPLSKRRGQ
jgi:NAD(P)-dependent dehydrogenase (short-subunit alcohol dehydrogenase family)